MPCLIAKSKAHLHNIQSIIIFSCQKTKSISKAGVYLPTFDTHIMIITSKAEEVIKLFEALGFAKTHAPSVNIETGEVTDVRMKHPEGYHVDVAGVDKLPKDMTIIRMNVDNFEEAYDLLISRGFKNNRGDGLVETASAKSATMISPSGFMISLIQHIKK